MDWINVILQGVLVGGLYAMFAAGLSLIFGVMRLVNIAHGDLIVLAAYIALVTTQTLGIGPLTSLLIVVPVMAVIGYALQWFVLNRTLGDDLLPPLLVTFGLSIVFVELIRLMFGSQSELVPPPPLFAGITSLGFMFYPTYRLAVVAVERAGTARAAV